jgi:hypothetical protein
VRTTSDGLRGGVKSQRVVYELIRLDRTENRPPDCPERRYL